MLVYLTGPGVGLQSYCNVFVQNFGFMKGSKRLDDVTFGLWLRYMPSQMYASVFSYVSTSSNHILLMKSNRYRVKKQYPSCSSSVSAPTGRTDDHTGRI